MAETVIAPKEPVRPLQLGWIPGVIFFPRDTLKKIVTLNRGTWLTPMLVLTLTALLVVMISGPIHKQVLASGQVEYPEGYQWWTPEQQAQFDQAQQARQSNTFIYVFPALMAIGKVWVGWLLVTGLFNLILTMLGGRGGTGSSSNLVAWAALPFAVRDLVRVGYMLSTKKLLDNPGLAGFAKPDGEGFALFITGLLALIDIYVLWHMLLLVLGVRSGTGLKPGKAWLGVILTILLALILQAALTFGTTLLGSLNVSGNFYFF